MVSSISGRGLADTVAGIIHPSLDFSSLCPVSIEAHLVLVVHLLSNSSAPGLDWDTALVENVVVAKV